MAATAAFAAAVLCLVPFSLTAQRQNNPRQAQHNSAPRQQKTHPQSPHQQNQGRPAQQYPNRQGQQYQPYRPPEARQVQRPATNPYAPPAAAGGVYPNQNYNSGNGRPAYAGAGTAHQLYAPPGHLGAWLNNHRNLPVQDQERMLRNDPSFRRLPGGEQERVMNQLHQVNQMPDAQRERRLARAENLERLSPEDRAQVAQSARRWTTLPADRQTMMRNAFRDLRSVVLNSSRYQGQFSPEERGILSNMLRVEPYAPPQP
jgi:hypothetical protein